MVQGFITVSIDIPERDDRTHICIHQEKGIGCGTKNPHGKVVIQGQEYGPLPLSLYSYKPNAFKEDHQRDLLWLSLLTQGVFMIFLQLVVEKCRR